MYRAEEGGGAGLTASHQRASSGAAKLVKRMFDVFGASLLLLLIAPILVLVAIGVAFTSGWPVIYSHKRVGVAGRAFNVLKFRSMRRDAERALNEHLDSSPAAREEWAAFQKLKSDPRVTPFGQFLRESSLDEIPQLWNVIKGEMSLVGPRPVTMAERSKYGAHWQTYCAVKPGITGMWQVNGRNSLTYEQRVAYDVQYVRRWSLLLDLKILAKTTLVVMRRDGSM